MLLVSYMVKTVLAIYAMLWVSWRALEEPFLRLKRLFSARNDELVAKPIAVDQSEPASYKDFLVAPF